MTFGENFNLFLKSNTEKTNEEKIKELRGHSVSDLLTLLENTEECPREYEREIIKSIYTCLYNKGVMCILK